VEENCIWHVIDMPCWCAISPGSEDNLRAALSKMGVNSRAMDDVMDKVRNRHYQVRVCIIFNIAAVLLCSFCQIYLIVPYLNCNVRAVGMHVNF